MTVPFFQHQIENIKEDRKKFGIFKGTGSGKTRIAVALAKGPTLVICPKTQMLDDTWVNEWGLQQKSFPLHVISFERFKKAIDEGTLDSKIIPQTVIIDEAHKASGVRPKTRQIARVKHPDTSQTFLYIVRYLNRIKPERIYPVTATPDAEPMKVFALAQILGCNWDFFEFRDTFYFEKKKENLKGREGLFFVIRTKENKKLIGQLVNRLGWTGRLEDWFDVPKQIYKPHKVGLTKQQLDEIPLMRLMYPDPRILTGKIHKIEQGISEEWVNNPDPDGPAKILVPKILKENKTEEIEMYFHQFKKVLVFAKYTEQILMYKRHFEKKGIKVFVLNGKTKDKDRKTQTKEADGMEECIYIAQSQVSAGWELPHFPAVIFASMNHSFIDYDQALGRVQRANNIKANTYIYLLGGIADEKVKKTIDEKLSFSEAKFAERYGFEITGITPTGVIPLMS